MKPDSNTHTSVQQRQHWMGVLARAEVGRLEQALCDLSNTPEYEHIRQPEIGMVMVRARAEAKGAQFNLGEMTVSRCSIRLADGCIGHGYVSGRNKRHAELAAVFDALLQCPEYGPHITESVIEPLHREHTQHRHNQAAKTAATKVNFFTMVRGED